MQPVEKKIALSFFRNSTHKSQEAKDRMFDEGVWLFDSYTESQKLGTSKTLWNFKT